MTIFKIIFIIRMDSQKKLDYNKKLKDRYNCDEDYRERKKQIAINYYYRKKYPNVSMSIEKQTKILYFD